MKVQTDNWELRINAWWSLKQGVTNTLKCPVCAGRGTVGGGFKDMNDPEECTQCWGSGKIIDPDFEPKPEMDEEFIKHMHKAYLEWANSETIG